MCFPVIKLTSHSIMSILIHSPYMSNHITRYPSIPKEQGKGHTEISAISSPGSGTTLKGFVSLYTERWPRLTPPTFTVWCIIPVTSPFPVVEGDISRAIVVNDKIIVFVIAKGIYVGTGENTRGTRYRYICRVCVDVPVESGSSFYGAVGCAVGGGDTVFPAIQLSLRGGEGEGIGEGMPY